MNRMKLSEAIREGCKQSCPAEGEYIICENDKVCACALGAAVITIKDEIKVISWLSLNRDPIEPYNILKQYFGEDLLITLVIHPIRQYRELLGKVIADLNDNHKWTREQIADWLEGKGY